jgi:hypothetical protein
LLREINEKIIFIHLDIADIFLILIGCLDFGIDPETIPSTQDQVNRCRSEMYLNPLMSISSLGFKLEGVGIV